MRACKKSKKVKTCTRGIASSRRRESFVEAKLKIEEINSLGYAKAKKAFAKVKQTIAKAKQTIAKLKAEHPEDQGPRVFTEAKKTFVEAKEDHLDH